MATYDILNGVTSSELTLNKGDMMNVSSGGTVNDTSVSSGGVMKVFSGGIANDTSVASGGTAYIGATGGPAIPGGVVNGIHVSGGGKLSAYSGAVLNDVYLGTDGFYGAHCYIFTGATTNRTTITTSVSLRVEGGSAVDTTISGGEMSLNQASAYAKNTIVHSKGKITISGGTLETATISSGAQLTIYKGVATGVTLETGADLQMEVFSGAHVQGTMNGSAFDFSFNDNKLTNYTHTAPLTLIMNAGAVASNTTLANGGKLQAYNNGVVSDTKVSSGGSLTVISSGSALNTEITSGGFVMLAQHGTADGVTVHDGGELHVSFATFPNTATVRNVIISSGGTMAHKYTSGTVDGITVKSGGSLCFTQFRDSATNLNLDEGASFEFRLMSATYLQGTYGGSAFKAEDAKISGFAIHSGVTMNVLSMGSATDTEILSGGIMNVMDGGTATGVNIYEGGRMSVIRKDFIKPNVVNDINLVSSAFLDVSLNGEAYGVEVGADCQMKVNDSGYAEDVTVQKDGYLLIMGPVKYKGYIGTVNSLTINNGGSCFVSSGGSANNVVIHSGGEMSVERNKTSTRINYARNVTVNYGGTLNVSSGGVATILFNPWEGTINAATGAAVTRLTRDAKIYYGGNASGIVSKADTMTDLQITSGNSAIVYDGGTLNGSLQIDADGAVIVEDGGTIALDLTTETSGGNALINDLSLVSGAPTYTVTVSADQATGEYKLADGAADFTGTITVIHPNNVELTLSVGGMEKYQDLYYGLFLDNGSLLLSVSDQLPPPTISVDALSDAWTNQNVVVTANFTGDVVTKQYSINGGEWIDYVDGVTMETNGTVQFKATGFDGTEVLSDVITVSKIDKVDPVITVGDYDKKFTEGEVVISATFTDNVEVASKQYSINGGEWIDYIGELTFVQNGTVQFKATDSAGNEVLSEVITIDNIGTTAPTVLPGGEYFTAIRKDGVITIKLNGDVDDFQLVMSADGIAYQTLGNGENGEYSFAWDKADEVYFKVAIGGGEFSAPIRFENNFVKGDTIGQLDKPVIGNLGKDENITDVYTWQQDTAGKFVLNGDFGNLNGSIVIKDEKNKTVASGTLKNGILTFNKNTPVLLDKGEYTITLQNTDKGKSAADYQFTISAELLYTKGNNSDDWTDVKTAGADGAVAKIGELKSDTIVTNWVGYGDAVDYHQFTLAHDTKLNLNISATDNVKVVIYKLNENKNGTFSLKALQTTTITAGYTNLTKDLLLEDGTYYIGVTSTNAKKGGNADYTISVDDKTKFFTKANNSDDWTDVKEKGAAGAVGRIDNFEIGTTVSDWVGYGDATDYRSFTITEDMTISFDVKSSDAAKFTLYTLNENKNGTFSLKSMLSASVTAGYTVPTKTITLAAGTYYIGMTSTNAKKGGDADYTITVKDPSVTVTPVIDNSDDWIDLKEKGADGAVAKLGALNADVNKTGWVGADDVVDYSVFTLGHAASLSFHVSATDATKFVIYELKENANGTFSLKALQTTSIKAGYTISTKDLLLETGKTYAIGVTSTNAKKGGSSEYNITLNEKSQFFTKANNRDDVFTDAKAIDITETNYGWVGYSDSVDYMEFTLDTAAKLNFDVTTSDSVKFVIYQLNDKTGKLKALQTTSVSANSTMPTKDLFLAAGTYYIGITSTNAMKGGDADYSFKLNSSAVFYPEAGDNSDDTWKLVQDNEAVKLTGADINGWVGYSDAADFVKLELDGSGAIKLELDNITATAYERKELKITCVNDKGKAIALTYDAATESFTSKLTFDEGTVCYVGVATSDQKKFNTEYQITAGILA